MCFNSDWTPQACWSFMGLHRNVILRKGMSVSDNNIFVNSKYCLDSEM